jgi:hypothetical protein
VTLNLSLRRRRINDAQDHIFSFSLPIYSVIRKIFPFRTWHLYIGRMGMTAVNSCRSSVSFCECHIRKKKKLDSFNCLETWLATKKQNLYLQLYSTLAGAEEEEQQQH